ncbi:MAG: GerMN domain-containing protein [Syntrophales bacterium]
MSTKKQIRSAGVKSKKTKKNKRTLILSVIVVVAVVFLAVFFITLFDYIYPPATGKHIAESKKEKIEVTLYFSDVNERYLLPEKRFLVKETAPERQAVEMVNALIAGSKTGLVNTFPPKAELLNITKEGNDTLLVDFRESLVKNHPGGSAAEMATIYSLTNTLTANLPEIKKVKILIEGKSRESLKGHIGLDQPFYPKKELLATPQSQ